MPPSSAPPPDNNPPRPPSVDADASANSGQKRPASPTEGPVRKAPVMDRQEKAVNSLPADSLTRLTLQETLEVFTLLERDADAAATVEGWAVISSHLINSVAKAIPGLHNGDDVEDSRAASRVQNALRDALRQFSFDSDDDAAMEEPADQAPTLPQLTPSHTSVQDVLLQVQKSFQALNSRLSRLESRVAHPTAHPPPKPTPPKPSAPSPNVEPPASSQTTPNPTSSFAKAAAKEPSTPAKTPAARPTTASEPKAPRYIIRFQGKPPANRETPLIISRRINQRLALTPSANGLRVIGSSWNASNNIVLTFPPKTTISHIEAHIPCIRKALTIDDAIPISHDVPWSRVHLAGVLAREAMGGSIIPDDILLRELLDNNSFLRAIRLTQGPHWIRNPENIGFKSSLSFAFEDPDGSIIKDILKRKIFMFGEEVRAKRWVEKPRLRQCSSCWSFGHFSCNKTICRICSGGHRTDDHRARCKGCRGELADKPCNCPPRCVNCKGDHPADSPECPDIRNFSIPANRARHDASAMES